MKKNITVTLGYYDYSFDNIFDAVKFADVAAKSCEKSMHIRVEVTYEEEDEDEV